MNKKLGFTLIEALASFLIIAGVVSIVLSYAFYNNQKCENLILEKEANLLLWQIHEIYGRYPLEFDEKIIDYMNIENGIVKVTPRFSSLEASIFVSFEKEVTNAFMKVKLTIDFSDNLKKLNSFVFVKYEISEVYSV